jgi:hypothetical protein
MRKRILMVVALAGGIGLAWTGNAAVAVQITKVAPAAQTDWVLVKAKKKRAYCGVIGCSWCCITSSGSTSCRRQARCGKPLPK